MQNEIYNYNFNLESYKLGLFFFQKNKIMLLLYKNRHFLQRCCFYIFLSMEVEPKSGV